MPIFSAGPHNRAAVRGRARSGASRRSPEPAVSARAAVPPDTAAPPPGLSGRALAMLLVGFSLSVTDFFIVNVALPTMARDLHASDASLELIVSGYGLAYALGLVLGGRLGDAFGRRRLFIAGMAAFTVTSLACGLAPTAAVLIVGRALQGAAAALMVPQVLATMYASLDGQRRARAVGMYGATAGVAMVAGQALGGLIVSADVAGSGWRGIFLVNVPVGLLGLLALARSLPETRSPQPAPIDRRGTVLLAVTLLCLLVPLTEGRTLGWPWWSWLGLAFVPFGALAFARLELAIEAVGRMPLVPPSIVRIRSVRRGIGVGIPFFGSFGGFMFVYAIVTQDGLHMRPVIAGLMLVPYALAFLCSSLSAARVVTAYGTRCMTAAAALQAAALAGLAGAVFADYPHLGWPLFALLFAALGFGQGLLVSPLFRIVLSRIPPHLAGAGTGVLTTAQQSSIAIGVALIGTLFTTLLAALGYARATAIVLAIQALISIGVALGTLLLPRAADAPEALPVQARETSAAVRAQAEVPGELA